MSKLLPHAVPLLFKNRLTELTFFCTDVCNMKCKHCFVMNELNKKTDRLSVNEILRMGEHIPYMQRVHVGGGEPFTRKDIADLVVSISNEWNAGVVCVPTNGWFQDNPINLVERFGKEAKGHLRLHFSINSPYEEDMDNFTQLKGSFERWRENLRAVSEHSKKYDNVTLVALTTYNDFNQDIFEELINFVVNETEADDFSFHLVRDHGDYQPDLDIDRFRELTATYFEKHYTGHPILRAFRKKIREIPLEYFDNPEKTKPCMAGKLRVVMSPDGYIYPCEKLGYPNGLDRNGCQMGNIRDFDYNLGKLLQSERAQAIQQRIDDSVCQCHHGIDSSMSLLGSHKFRMEVLYSALKYVFTKSL